MDFAVDTDLLADVDRASQEWQQGDIASLGVAGWFGVAELALTEPMSKVRATNTTDNVGYALATVESLVVLSQTCDLVRAAKARPFVVAAPLVRLASKDAVAAARGRRPRYVAVPGIGADAFVDLDVVVTFEKAVLLRVTRGAGVRTDQERRRFGVGIARSFSRFAFPDDLTASVRPMIRHIRDTHGRNSDQGRAYELLEEVRVTATPSWDADEVHVFVTFAPPTRLEANALVDDERWDQLVDGWLSRAVPFGKVAFIDGAMIPLDELTARDYVDSDQLDLDDLSRS